MWLIRGPFECEQSGDELTTKSKLLLANRVYDVGRHQESSLCINSKKISRQHGQFIVGEHSEDDVSNEALVPTLSFRNNRPNAINMLRGDDTLVINPESMRELESGDTIRLTGSITATVTWEPKVCFYTPTEDLPTFDLSACASLGVKLVTKHSRDVTHHLTPALTAPLPPPVLYSLLTPAHLVTPAWAIELIKSGPDLEKTYEPLSENAFRPQLDKSLPVAMKKKTAWDPNGARKALFEDMRFAFAVLGSGAGSLAKAMADVVSRGGGSRQLVNVEKEVEGAAGTWGNVLKKRKIVLRDGLGSGLVLVGDAEAMTARGVPKEARDAWEGMVEKARSVNMRIVHPSLISEAICQADASILDCVVQGGETGPSNSKSLPDYIPSTHPEEPSQPPDTSQTSGAGPSRRLTRRAASQTPAPESAPPAPMEVEEPAPAPAPRKLLKRRAKTGGLVNELLGLDDSTVVLGTSESQLQSQSQDVVQPVTAVRELLVPPTPARASRLKRRAGAGAVAPSTQLFPELNPTSQEDGAEPPLKKFKALFEGSGHGGTDQTEASGLMVVREEEEESQSQSMGLVRKRKADAMEEDQVVADVEMQVAEGSGAAAGAAQHKRRAVEDVNAVEPSQPPKKPASRTTTVKGANKGTDGGKTKGAAPGKPDTDPSFLRAIASTKKGKKTEDAFDREFNKLRIAKPDVHNDANGVNNGGGEGAIVQWEKEWDGLGDFEKDVGVRGNFMQILEIEVWRQDRDRAGGRDVRRDSGLGARIDWDGREDFKKFRRKLNLGPREAVQLVVSEQQDYGAGESYWESNADKAPRGFDDMSQSQDQSFSQPRFTQTQATAPKSRPKSQPKPKPKATAFPNEDDEDEGEEARGPAKGKGKSQANGKGKASQTGKKQALFQVGSEEDDDMDAAGPGAGAGETLQDDDDDVLDLTLPSTMKTTQAKSQPAAARGTKRKAIVVEESDSDDGVTFAGFSKRAKKSGLRSGR